MKNMSNYTTHFFLKEASLLTVLVLALLATCVEKADAQEGAKWNTSTEPEERSLFSTYFHASEFAERRNKVYDSIGKDAVLVIQGAPMPMGFQVFRQNNEFFYLTGIVSPHAYLVLDGRSRKATVYLQDRLERREYNEGRVLSYQDASEIKTHSGIDDVKHIGDLVSDLRTFNGNRSFQKVYFPISPAEEMAITRSIANRTIGDYANDPLDERLARHQEFRRHLDQLMPRLEKRNINPITDELRKIKSPTEIKLITKSTRLQGEAIMESMRATRIGILPQEMEAIGRYIYWKNGADGEGYYALTHVGPDAHMNHYHSSKRAARDGDMILMDYGPVYHYYTSDMGRMWPANGTFNSVQRELYTFYLEFYESILYSIEIGLTPSQIMRRAIERFDPIFETMQFSDQRYREAAIQFVDSYRNRLDNPRMGLGHGVGMSVHDVGDYSGPVVPGMVFVIEPQFRVSEELIYIRLEDMIVVTENGVEVISDFVPRDIEGIEALMREESTIRHNIDW